MKVSDMRFPEKLFHLVSECTSGALQWSESGNTILVEYKKLKKEILNAKDNFKSEKVDSFIRQLNLYGFRKCNRYGEEVNEYKHPSFLRGRKDLIYQIRRRSVYKTKHRRRNNNHLVSRTSSGSTTPAAEPQVNTPPSQNQSANEILSYWMNQYYLQCPGFSPGMMFPQRDLTQEYHNYFNSMNMSQDLESYVAKKGFVSPSHATNLNPKDASSSYVGDEQKTSVTHEQKTGVTHEHQRCVTHDEDYQKKTGVTYGRMTGVTHEQKISVNHDWKTSLSHEQNIDVDHEKTGVTHEQKIGVTHDWKAEVTHDTKIGVNYGQMTGMTHEQKTDWAPDCKTGLTHDNKTGGTYERVTGVSQEHETGASHDWKTGVTYERKKTIVLASPPKRSISVKVGNSAFVDTSTSINVSNAAKTQEVVLNENESVLKRGSHYFQQQEPNSVGKESVAAKGGKSAILETAISNAKQSKSSTEISNKKNCGTMTWNDYSICGNPNFCYVIVPTPNPGLYRGPYPGSQMPFLYSMPPAGMFSNNGAGSSGCYPGYVG